MNPEHLGFMLHSNPIQLQIHLILEDGAGGAAALSPSLFPLAHNRQSLTRNEPFNCIIQFVLMHRQSRKTGGLTKEAEKQLPPTGENGKLAEMT